MRIKNYQAETVSRALRMAREELGSDAVVLKTTQIPPEGRLGRCSGRLFQVTACVDDGMLPATKARALSDPPVQPAASEDSVGVFGDILRELRRDMKYLIGSGRVADLDERISPVLLPHYYRLTSQEVDPTLAARFVSEVEELDSDTADDMAVRNAMLGIIKRSLPEDSEIRLFAGKQTRVALVGPPGSGKSSLTAKLASHFVVEKKLEVTLVSLDDFKPTASDELGRYGRALKVPCIGIESLANRKDSGGVILVDTAGIPVGAGEEIRLLQSELSQIDIDEIHLVLPAYCRWEDLRNWHEFFKPLNPTAVALSFLDQTEVYGAAVNLAVLEGARLSYFSTGRTSLAHLTPADASMLAERLIGFTGKKS